MLSSLIFRGLDERAASGCGTHNKNIRSPLIDSLVYVAVPDSLSPVPWWMPSLGLWLSVELTSQLVMEWE
jgi:hypothetical protein